MYGHWDVTKVPPFDPGNHFGFVYCITNLTTNQQYIGKKQFFSITTKLKPGKKNRTRTRKESNWRKYTSSSKYVNELIIELGKHNFHFEILSLHNNKGSLSYAELEAQVINDVLRAKLPSGQRKYYNNAILANIRFIPTE